MGSSCTMLVFLLFLASISLILGQNIDKRKEIQQEQSSGGIHWYDLSVTSTRHKDDGDSLILLHPCSGHVQRGQMCAILGPSGAGKSTLLKALGGITSTGAHVDIEGSVVWQEQAGSQEETLSIRDGQVAYLQQHDAFFGMLSTRETLELATFLEFPHSKRQERDDLVEKSLDALGLRGVQHRRIGKEAGGARLSGGERRRLSVALELVTTPLLMLADEPTTGLDSSQAHKVVKTIAELSKQRSIPCVCILHQPRASIWKLLDSIVLLAPGGHMAYMGSRKDAVAYFEDLGYGCPSETNPAEFLLDLVSIDTEDPAQEARDHERIDHIARAFVRHSSLATQAKLQQSHTVATAKSSNLASRKGHSPLLYIRRSAALLRRSLRQNIRNHRVNLLRLGASAGNAVLFSQIFKTVRKGVPTAKSLGDRTALLSFGVINMAMMAIMKTMDLFAKERPVVDREETRRQYTSIEYLFAKAVAEIPLDTFFSCIFTAVLKKTTGLRIPFWQLTASFSLLTVSSAALGFLVGSLTHSDESAIAAGMPVMVILMVVGIINPSGVDKTRPPPQVVQWLKQVSPIRWAVEALCLAEFRGMQFEDSTARSPWQKLRNLPKMGAFAMVKNGDQVLDALGLEDATYESVMVQLALLAGMNLCLSWMGLHFGGTTFVKPNNLSPDSAKQPRTLSSQKKSNDLLTVPVVRTL